MHMQNQVFPEVIPKMLAHGEHPFQLSSINHRSIGKPPLRPIHPDSLPCKRSRVPLGPSMNLVPFRHLLSTSLQSPAFDVGSASSAAVHSSSTHTGSIM